MSPSFSGFTAASPCQRKASLIVIHNGNVVQQVQVFTKRLKKVQIASLLFATLESITREQDVITSLMTYYISHALPSHWMTGGIFRSKAALRNRALTENKCLIHF